MRVYLEKVFADSVDLSLVEPKDTGSIGTLGSEGEGERRKEV